MNVSIVTKQFVELHEDQRAFIEKKFRSLEHVAQHPAFHCEVDITKGGHGGYTVSATATLEGEVFHDSAERSSIMEGVDEVVRTLAHTITLHKKKARTIAKRTGDMFKKMARFGRG
jgi:ribosome-associated translation inhibitor RaiA